MTSRLRMSQPGRLLAISLCGFACYATAGLAGKPDFQAVSMVFTDSLPQVALAVTRAFTNGAYHWMPLSAFPYDYVVVGQKRISVPRTNTWNLDSGALPLTLVARG